MDTRDISATTISISGDALSVAGDGDSGSLAEFSTTITSDANAGTSSIDFSGFLMSSAFDGEVFYETTSPLTFTNGDVPDGGVIVITGAENASVTVTILGAGAVELDIDSNGDGNVDDVVMTTWLELDA